MKKTLITIYEPTKRFKTEDIETDSFIMPTVLTPDDRYIVCDTDEKSVHINNLIRDGYYNYFK